MHWLTFHLTPQGVLCYDFCHELDILATGSMDHTVRLWNPYVPSKPMALLRAHTTSILDVVIAKDTGLIFSYSQDSVGLHGSRKYCTWWHVGSWNALMFDWQRWISIHVGSVCVGHLWACSRSEDYREISLFSTSSWPWSICLTRSTCNKLTLHSV